MNLSDLAPSPRDVDDLTWRFNGEAAAEMGLHSNMGGFVSLIERGIGNRGAVDIDNGRQTAAATRARRIDSALAIAGVVRGEAVSRLAALHFGAPPIATWAPAGHVPPRLVRISPALELVDEAAELHRRARSRRSLPDWLQRLAVNVARGRASKADESHVRELQRLEELVVAQVVDAYGRARGKLPRVLRREPVYLPSLTELVGLAAG